jgi:hypothetical protein
MDEVPMFVNDLIGCNRQPESESSFRRAIFKMLDQVRGQGAGRRKSAAYMGVCEHFE